MTGCRRLVLFSMAATVICLLYSVSGMSSAHADHPFDPRRYAYELFSEDEILLSEHAATLDESVVTDLLDQSWAELDTIAMRTAGKSAEESRRMIQAAVRGEGGVSDRFQRKLEESAGIAGSRGSMADRLKRAARHPAVWALPIAFVAALIWINRRPAKVG